MLIHFFEISFKRQLVCKFCVTENTIFIVFDYLYVYVFVHVVAMQSLYNLFRFALFSRLKLRIIFSQVLL